MKRKILPLKAIIAFAYVYFFFNTVSAQNPFWTFPEEGFDNQNGTTLLNLPIDDYMGQEADYIHAGLRDPYQEIMFFMLDGKLYNESGVERAEFDDGTQLIKGTSEALIVPQPGSCNRFYIFQGEPNGAAQGSEFPHFSIYDDTLNTLLEADPQGVYKSSWNMVSDLTLISDTQWGNADHGVKGVHFAATRQFGDSTRWVFVSNNNSVFRFNLDCDGLTGLVWEYELFTGFDDLVENGWRSEMELFEDTANNVVKVATPYFKQDAILGDIKIATFDIDSITGNVITSSRVDIPFENQTNQSPTYVHGLEFSPNGKLLYIIHDPFPNYPSPFSYYDFVSGTLTNLNYTDIANFQNSQLQLAGNPLNYTIYVAGATHLGALSNPNTPSPLSWNPTAIPLAGGYSSNFGAQSVFSSQDEKRIIPDQIDYMFYDAAFIEASCDCCYKYAYNGPKQDTSRFVSTTENWAPGIGGNPWNALATDTIFIRDSIFVEKGANLEIRDLNFRFARDGVIVVDRGDEITPGGILTITDSTHITSDFRCTDLNYVCRDSLDDKCEERFWQGIRVEGYDDQAQSLFNSVQGRLNMDEGSTIEYAQIGILAGHENFNGYGGGIVRISDSKIKDCPISVRFEGYIANDGSGGELFNLARINNMNFTWTFDLLNFEKITPDVHVDIIRSSGIFLRGNTYQNEAWALYAVKNRGVGVDAIDSRVNISYLCNEPIPANPCQSPEVRPTFLNLSIGVLASSVSSTRTLYTGYGEFENNNVGIQTSALINPELLDNEFRVPNLDDASGIFLLSSTGYVVENNSFTSMALSPVNYNLGIRISASGPAINYIYNNFFEDITIGIGSELENADCVSVYQEGLRWKCNRFDQFVPYADIYVHSGNTSNEQGECSPLGEPAGNIFSHTPNGGHDIRVREAELILCNSITFDIEYNYHDVTGSTNPLVVRLEPLTFTPLRVNPQMCPGDFPSLSDCPIQSSGAPPGKGTAGVEGSGKSNDEESMSMEDFALALSQMHGELLSLQGEDGVTSVKESLTDLWNSLISAFQADTLNAFPKDAVWNLLQENQPDFVAGRFASALAMELNHAIPEWVSTKNNSDPALSDIAISFSDASLPDYLSDLVEEDQLNYLSNVTALVELYHQMDSRYFPTPLNLTDELPESYGDNDGKNNSGSGINGNDVRIIPNPFSDNFQVLIESGLEHESFQFRITDLMGRLVLEGQTNASSGYFIDGSTLQKGVYIINVFIAGRTFASEKIIKVN